MSVVPPGLRGAEGRGWRRAAERLSGTREAWRIWDAEAERGETSLTRGIKLLIE